MCDVGAVRVKKHNYNAGIHSTMRSCIQIVMLLYITEDHKKHRVADKGCQISWKTKTSLERWYCGATGNSMDKDSKGQRKLKDSGGGLLAAVKGRSLQQKTEYNTRLRLRQTESWRTGPPRWPSSMVCTWRAGNMGLRPPSLTPPPPLTLWQQWWPCQASRMVGSPLGLVGPASVYCDWKR